MSDTRGVSSEQRPTRRTLLVSMTLSVAAVLGLGLWSTGGEMDASLSRLAVQQSFLALTLAHDLSNRLALFEENARLAKDAGDPPLTQRMPVLGNVLSHLEIVQREGQLLVLVRLLGDSAFITSDYRVFPNRQLHQAFAHGDSSLVIDRDTAHRLGLSRHRALAGLATVEAPDKSLAPLQIAVIQSAASERARVYRAQWRNVLTGLTAIAVVLWFGRLALRQQRRELALGAELERSQLAAERDAQLSRADRFAMLAALSTGIAHELGSPLGVIVGRLEQLAPLAAGNERATRALTSMNEQTERMNGIIRGFLALARGETPVLQRSSPRAIVEAARELVRHRFVQAGIRLDVELPETPPQVLLDGQLFTHVLVNLLVNACQASARGEVVTLRVFEEPDQLVFEVVDHGAGIRPDAAKRATEPFFTTRAQDGGTGLGLAIANEITQQHRGVLELLPMLDATGAQRGTRARVRLPLATPRHESAHDRGGMA